MTTGAHRIERAADRKGRHAGTTSGQPRIAVWVRHHPLSLFITLAFLLSWLPWPLVLLNPDSSPLVPFGPLIAAVITALLTGGLPQLRTLLDQLGRWRIAPGWYLLALTGPLALFGAAAALTTALGAHPDPIAAVDPAQVAATFAATLILIGLFEEVGWRGYALPLLQQRMARVPAALLLGAVWALWHLPELLSEPTGQRPTAQFLILVVAQSVVLSWLYNRTSSSLPIVITTHTAVDTVARFVLPLFTAEGYQLIWWILTGLWIIAAAVVIAVDRIRPEAMDESR